MDPARIAVRASTQDHLEIEDIQDGIVILKDGGACLLMGVTSINFDLLSEREQEAAIWSYAALLNSLNFPIQIFIRSQQKDITSYLKLLQERAIKETRPLIKEQIVKYAKFVKETVQKNNVLDKKFYLVIPMSALETGLVGTVKERLLPGKKLPFDVKYILEKAKINLNPKRDHTLRLLGRLGLKGRQLDTSELIKLFFEIYNPESPGQQAMETRQYQTPLVQTQNLAKPTTASAPPTSPPPIPAPTSAQKPIPESSTSPAPSPSPTLPLLEEDTIQNQIANLVKESSK
jgi:hypothetical protein